MRGPSTYKNNILLCVLSISVMIPAFREKHPAKEILIDKSICL
jgi:hypothetical protein